jgi:hypothetical protein
MLIPNLFIFGDYALYVFRILTLAAQRMNKLSQLLDMSIHFLYITVLFSYCYGWKQCVALFEFNRR